jgi:DNA-binding LytR/AlgR family response regulator
MLYKAVVIDDEKFVAEELKYFLEMTGLFKVLKIFGSALDAATYLQKTPQEVHFVFCDVVMEDMLGVNAVKILRKFSDFVVLVTAHLKEYAGTGETHLADAALEKPLEEEKLIELVDKLTNPRDPTGRLKVPSYIWAKKIPLPTKKKDTTDSANNKEVEKDDENDDVRIEIADIVYLKRNGNYVDIWGMDSDRKIVSLARCKTSIEALYKKWEYSNLFLYVNHGELVHVAHIIRHDPEHVTIPGGWGLWISAKGKPYYHRYLKQTGLAK